MVIMCVTCWLAESFGSQATPILSTCVHTNVLSVAVVQGKAPSLLQGKRRTQAFLCDQLSSMVYFVLFSPGSSSHMLKIKAFCCSHH